MDFIMNRISRIRFLSRAGATVTAVTAEATAVAAYAGAPPSER
jgi:hypothetical protein